jgi:hypothetical protein
LPCSLLEWIGALGGKVLLGVSEEIINDDLSFAIFVVFG